MTGDDGKADIASQLNNREQLSKLLFTYSSRALLNGDELVRANVWKLFGSAISPADCQVRSVFSADLTNYGGARCPPDIRGFFVRFPLRPLQPLHRLARLDVLPDSVHPPL